jgi:hypothetical protein
MVRSGRQTRQVCQHRRTGGHTASNSQANLRLPSRSAYRLA